MRRAKVKDYVWAQRYSHKGVDPDVAAKELDRIADDAGGVVKVRAVVEASRGAKAPLHPLFEWSDKDAAEAHRRQQARDILQSLIVVYEGAGGQTVEVPYVVSYTPKPEQGEPAQKERSYIPISDVRNDKTLREAIVERAWEELLAWEARYEHLAEFLNVRKAIRKTRKEVDA